MVGRDDRRRGPRELQVPVEHRNGDRLAGMRRETFEHRRVARRIEGERRALPGPVPAGKEHPVVEVEAVESRDGRDLARLTLLALLVLPARLALLARLPAAVQGLAKRRGEGRLAGCGGARDTEEEPPPAGRGIGRKRGEHPLDRRLEAIRYGTRHFPTHLFRDRPEARAANHARSSENDGAGRSCRAGNGAGSVMNRFAGVAFAHQPVGPGLEICS